MQFNFDNKPYAIRFQYETQTRRRRTIQITTVKIKAPGKDGMIFWTADVVRYAKDQDNRDMARRYALKKVLVDKDVGFRTAVWHAYHTRPGGIHYQKP